MADDVDNILKTIKRTLGLAEDYTVFDSEIMVHINSVFSTLNQLGVGPADGFELVDGSENWEDFIPLLADDITLDPRYNSVKSYIYISVRLLWDPPTIGYVLTSWEKLKEQAEWRLQVLADPPYVSPDSSPLYDDMGDPIIP